MNFDRRISDEQLVSNVLKHQELNQRQLADMLEVSPPTISQWKKGAEVIPHGRLEALLKLSSYPNAQRGWKCLSEFFDSEEELELWAGFYRIAHTRFYESDYRPDSYFDMFEDGDEADLVTTYALHAYDVLKDINKAGFNIIPSSFTLEQVEDWYQTESDVSEISYYAPEPTDENRIYYLCDIMQKMFNDFGGYESWLDQYMWEPSFVEVSGESLVVGYGTLLTVESVFLSIKKQENEKSLDFYFPDLTKTITAIRENRKSLIEEIKNYIEEMRNQNLPLTVDYFQILDFPNEGNSIWEYSHDGWEWLQDNYYFDAPHFARPRIEDYQSAEIKSLRRMIERGFSDIHKVLAANGFKPPKDGLDSPQRHSAPSTLIDH